MPAVVLQVVTTLNRGGLETMLLNYYRNINRDKIQFDFLLHREGKSDYEEEALSLGANIYRVPPVNPLSPGYYKALDNFFCEHKYDVVHSHLDCMSAFVLAAAKKHGIKHRFSHAHNVNQVKDLKYPMKLLSKSLIPYYSTELFACGKEAGDWMFSGNQYRILNNAIDARRYSFNAEVSAEYRELFGLNGKFVIGHVGRFTPQKNHSFLIDIFSSVVKKVPDSALLLIGTGEGEAEIKARVNSLGLSDKVKFLGVRDDIDKCLQCMDVFLFPSLFEGLSVATVEAQAAGLPCVLSDTIPHECKITDNVEFVSLHETPGTWAEHVVGHRKTSRTNQYESIRKAGFDIIENAEFLQNFYLDKVNANEG